MVLLLITDGMHAIAVLWFLSSSVALSFVELEKNIYWVTMVRLFYGARLVICCILHLFTERLISMTDHRDCRTLLTCFTRYDVWKITSFLLKLIVYVANKLLTWNYLVLLDFTVAWKLYDLGKSYLWNFSNFLVTTARTEEKIAFNIICVFKREF